MDGHDDDAKVGYSWETNVKRTWESVGIDEQGNLLARGIGSGGVHEAELEKVKKARLKRITQSIRRGLIRYLIICLDCSKFAYENDYKPNRLHATKTVMEKFIYDYFDQNPISQLSLMSTIDRHAEKLTDMSGNIKYHVNLLKNTMTADGVASLQNILQLAIIILKHIPDYGCRELLIIYNSLSTTDPGNIFDTIEKVKEARIRCSVICLSGEIYICKKLTEMTDGIFSVALNQNHLQELVLAHITPPPEVKNNDSDCTDFIYVGFPKRSFDNNPILTYDGRKLIESSVAFVCPRCKCRTTEIPAMCNVCGLQLNSSAHIARSHHHLFPVSNFVEYVDGSEKDIFASLKPTLDNVPCQGCFQKLLKEAVKMQCPHCKKLFCVDCDIFIHDSLHNCPGCNDADIQ